MPSSSVAKGVFALAVVVAIGNLWTTFERSLIPRSINDVAVGVEVRKEKHPGLDDVFILRLAGEKNQVVIDREVASHFDGGEVVDKDAWSSGMTVGGESVQLDTSRDFNRMLVAMPLIVVWAVLILRRRPPRVTKHRSDVSVEQSGCKR